MRQQRPRLLLRSSCPDTVNNGCVSVGVATTAGYCSRPLVRDEWPHVCIHVDAGPDPAGVSTRDRAAPYTDARRTYICLVIVVIIIVVAAAVSARAVFWLLCHVCNHRIPFRRLRRRRSQAALSRSQAARLLCGCHTSRLKRRLHGHLPREVEPARLAAQLAYKCAVVVHAGDVRVVVGAGSEGGKALKRRGKARKAALRVGQQV